MKPWTIEVMEHREMGMPRAATRWWVRLLGGNGEITMVGESHPTRAKAQRAADRLQIAGLQGFKMKSSEKAKP